MEALLVDKVCARIWSAGPRTEDLAQRVAGALRDQIETGELPVGTKLMPEAHLAAALRVSRPTLREAIRMLSQARLLHVRHGVGTFVTEPPRPVQFLLEHIRSMTDIIERSGGRPSIRDLKIDFVEPPIEVKVALAVRSKVGRISRVRLSDDRAFGVATEYVALPRGLADFRELQGYAEGSLYGFLKTRLGREVSLSETTISAVCADAEVSRILKVKPGSPLLLMRETHYDEQRKPFLFSINLHNTEVAAFTTVRSKLLS